MTKDFIRYDLLVQDALKNVVRKVLGDAIRDGLPGEHHFYISFKTEFPGVRLSTRMREKYPQDMTIVLQHQFWDLSVTEHAIEVGLSFSGVPERLLIPFDALTGFFDPSVQFGLKFEIQDPPAQTESRGGGQVEAFRNVNEDAGSAPREIGRTRSPRGAASEPDETEPRDTASFEDANQAKAAPAAKSGSPGKPAASKAAGKARKAGTEDESGRGSENKGSEDKDSEHKGSENKSAGKNDENAPAGVSADVVSLDSFRKKS